LVTDSPARIQDAAPAAARQGGGWELQEARLEVLAAEDRSLPHRAIHQLDDDPDYRSVMVVPVQDIYKRGRIALGCARRGTSGRDLVCRGQERGMEVGESLED
jgi:hypothetical protein